MCGASGGEVRTYPKLPWRIRIFLAVFRVICNASLRCNGTVNLSLMTLVDFKVPPSDKPVHEVTTSDTMVDPSRHLWFRYFRQSSSRGYHLLLVPFPGKISRWLSTSTAEVSCTFPLAPSPTTTSAAASLENSLPLSSLSTTVYPLSTNSHVHAKTAPMSSNSLMKTHRPEPI